MKHSFFKLLKKALYSLYLLHLYLQVERVIGWKRAVISLCFHSTPETDPSDPISILEAGTSRKSFENQINILSKWLQPIDDHQLLNWFNHTAKLQRDGLLVTFDDGYKNNQTVAAPILQSQGVPGLIFVPTNFITCRKQFWWSRLSNAMRAMEPSQWKSLSEKPLPSKILEIVADEDLANWPSRKKARRRIGLWLNQNGTANSVIQILESVTVPQRDPNMALLTWDEIKTMHSSEVIHFGSHTHTHPCLTRLPDAELGPELQAGSESFKEHLGLSPLSLAYPGGHVDQRVEDQAADAGFQLAFTTQQGIIRPSSNRLQLPRLYLGFSTPYEIYFALALINLAKYFPVKMEAAILRLARS